MQSRDCNKNKDHLHPLRGSHFLLLALKYCLAGSAPPPTQPVIPASSPPPSTPGFPADAPPSPLNPSDPTGPTNPVDPATPDRPSSNPGSDDDFSGGGSGSGSGSGGSSGSDSRYPWLPGYNPGTGDHMEGSFPEYGSSDDFTDSRSSGSAEGIGAYLPAWGGASSSSLDGAGVVLSCLSL